MNHLFATCCLKPRLFADAHSEGLSSSRLESSGLCWAPSDSSTFRSHRRNLAPSYEDAHSHSKTSTRSALPHFCSERRDETRSRPKLGHTTHDGIDPNGVRQLVASAGTDHPVVLRSLRASTGPPPSMVKGLVSRLRRSFRPGCSNRSSPLEQGAARVVAVRLHGTVYILLAPVPRMLPYEGMLSGKETPTPRTL